MLTLVLAVLAGFTLLLWGADRFVIGASAMARNLGVSPLVIGLTIVGFGTSAPEMLVSGVAAWSGSPGLAMGNAVGSSIANIALVLGVSAVLRPVAVHSTTLRRELPMLMGVTLLALALLIDGELGRADGLIMMFCMIAVLYWVVRVGLGGGRHDPMAEEFAAEMPKPMSTAAAVGWTGAGLLILVGSSRLVVWGAVGIAEAFGVDDLIIGLTIVAVGTSLPELAASAMSVYRDEPDIAVGNIVGSNMFNTLAVLGIAGLIAPAAVPPDLLTRDFPILTVLTAGLIAMSYGFHDDGRISRLEGAALAFAFAGYLVVIYLSSV